MKIETTQTLPPRETIKKKNTLDATLADTQTVELMIDRGTNIEYRSRNLPQNMIYQRNSHRHDYPHSFINTYQTLWSATRDNSKTPMIKCVLLFAIVPCFQLDRVTYSVVIIEGNYVWIKLTDTIFVLRI